MSPDFEGKIKKVPHRLSFPQGVTEGNITFLPASREATLPTKKEYLPESTDRAHSKLSDLFISEHVASIMGNATERIAYIHEAFTEMERDMLLILPDAMVDYDENGLASGATIYVVSPARNSLVFTEDNQLFRKKIKAKIAENPKNPITNHDFVQSKNEGNGWITYTVDAPSATTLPVKIAFTNEPDINLEEIIDGLTKNIGNTFSAYRTHEPAKTKPEDMKPDEKIQAILRDPNDFYRNLDRRELQMVNQIVNAIDFHVFELPSSSIALLAEGSATTGTEYNDIDLRVIYTPDLGRKLDANPVGMLRLVKDALIKSGIRPVERIQTDYRHKIEDKTIYHEVPGETSLKVLVPETGIWIQIIIARNPMDALEDLYKQNENRPDLPVILDILKGEKNFTLKHQIEKPTTSKPRIK